MPATAPEEGGVDGEYDDEGAWGDGESLFGSWWSESWRAACEYALEVEWAEANPVFDFDGMKQRRASRHAVGRSYTTLSRIRRTAKRDFGRTSHQEPIGSRKDIWRESLEKGARTADKWRRCRCSYCMQLATLTQERRAFRWAVRRTEQGKDWAGGKWSTDKKPRWVDHDWDVVYGDGDGDTSEIWDGAEGAFEPEWVPPMEVDLLELVRIRGPQSRRAVQARLSLYSGVPGQRGTISESTEPTATSGPPPFDTDRDWELLSVYSDWDRCSVQSLEFKLL
jgi:hypothetical protein